MFTDDLCDSLDGINQEADLQFWGFPELMVLLKQQVEAVGMRAFNQFHLINQFQPYLDHENIAHLYWQSSWTSIAYCFSVFLKKLSRNCSYFQMQCLQC